jgi:hypothetical protein
MRRGCEEREAGPVACGTAPLGVTRRRDLRDARDESRGSGRGAPFVSGRAGPAARECPESHPSAPTRRSAREGSPGGAEPSGHGRELPAPPVATGRPHPRRARAPAAEPWRAGRDRLREPDREQDPEAVTGHRRGRAAAPAGRVVVPAGTRVGRRSPGNRTQAGRRDVRKVAEARPRRSSRPHPRPRLPRRCLPAAPSRRRGAPASPSNRRRSGSRRSCRYPAPSQRTRSSPRRAPRQLCRLARRC